MIVEDVIHLAKYSELSNIAAKDNVVSIIAFINLGMIELYKRFALKRVEYTISIVEGQTVYDMPNDFMYATSAFKKVLICGKLHNENVPINEEQSVESIFFPTYNQVQIPDNLDLEEVSVVYVPKPIRYTVATIDQELDLPEVLLDCLLHYLGYKAHLGIRSDGQSENNYHALRFERSIKKAKELGVCPSTDYYKTTSRIADKGFV